MGSTPSLSASGRFCRLRLSARARTGPMEGPADVATAAALKAAGSNVLRVRLPNLPLVFGGTSRWATAAGWKPAEQQCLDGFDSLSFRLFARGSANGRLAVFE